MTRAEYPQNVTVLGAGRWGAAMAIHLSRKGLSVTLQCHLREEYESLKKNDSAPNLPNFDCGEKIKFDLDLNRSLEKTQLVIVAMPVAFLRGVLKRIERVPPEAIIVSINKGIERETLKTPPEIIGEYFKDNTLAHLGGPCFPEGLLSNFTLAAETLACEDEEVGLLLQRLFSGPSFRVYRSLDLKGVALMGALKNIYAIIAGAGEGMGMHEEIISVIVTRGLSEMKRLCQSLNIQTDTLYGLSGLGDLALTCYSPKSSHNKNFGKRLGKGEKVADILADMGGTVAEGYYTIKAVEEIAKKYELDLPMCRGIYRVIYDDTSVVEGLKELVNRPLKLED